jgi:hypothetical protein
MHVRKSLFAICTLALASAPAWAQPTPGTYKILSFDVQLDGAQSVNPLGKNPKGYIVLTKSTVMSMITGDSRTPAKTPEEKAALLDSMIAYTGPYRVEGDKLIVDVEASWTQAWAGKPQTRAWSLEGNRLTLVTERAPYPRDPTKMAVLKLLFEKVE